MPAVRAVGHRVQRPAPFLSSGLLSRSRRGRRLPVPDGQRLQPVGARARRHRAQPRQRRPVGLRLRRAAPRTAGPGRPSSGRSRPSSSGRRCCSPVIAVGPGRGRATAGPADAARRAGGPGARVLRASRPASTSATCYPFFALGVILAAISLALADRLRRSCRVRPVREHVRGPDRRSIRTTRGSRTGSGSGRRSGPSRPSRRSRSCIARRRSSGRSLQLRAVAPATRLEDELGAASTDEPAAAPRTTAPTSRGAARRSGRPRAGVRRGSRPAGDRALACAGAVPRPAGAARAVATMPTWTARPTFERARARRLVPGAARRARRSGPTGARSLRRRGRRPARPARPVVRGRARRRRRWSLRTFRLDEPYQMHFDEVYHARTATEFLQDWRYGLSHDIYEWTHPHLAKYAMAAGLVLWGEDHVKRHERPRRAGRSPRSSSRGGSTRPSPGGRAGERLHVATGTEIRTYDLRTRAADLDHPGARGHAPWPSTTSAQPAGRRLRRRPGRRRSTSTAIGDGRRRRRRRRRSTSATVDHPVEHLLSSPRTAPASSPRRPARPARRRRLCDRARSSGALDLPGIADLAPRRQRLGARGDGRRRDRPAAVASSLADILGTAARRTTRRGSRGVARARRSSSATRGAATRGPSSRRRSPTGRCRASASTGRAAGRGRDRRRASPSSTRDRGDGRRRRSRSTAARTAWPMVTGLDDPKLYATSGDAAHPSYDVIAIGGDAAKDGPVDQGRTSGSHPLPGLGTRVVYDEASQMVHILGLAPGRDRRAGRTRGPSTSSSRTATRSSPTPGCPDGFAPSAWGADFNPDYPSERPPAAPRLRRRRGVGRRSTSARTPSPGGCPGSSPAR